MHAQIQQKIGQGADGTMAKAQPALKKKNWKRG